MGHDGPGRGGPGGRRRDPRGAGKEADAHRGRDGAPPAPRKGLRGHRAAAAAVDAGGGDGGGEEEDGRVRGQAEGDQGVDVPALQAGGAVRVRPLLPRRRNAGFRAQHARLEPPHAVLRRLRPAHPIPQRRVEAHVPPAAPGLVPRVAGARRAVHREREDHPELPVPAHGPNDHRRHHQPGQGSHHAGEEQRVAGQVLLLHRRLRRARRIHRGLRPPRGPRGDGPPRQARGLPQLAVLALPHLPDDRLHRLRGREGGLEPGGGGAGGREVVHQGRDQGGPRGEDEPGLYDRRGARRRQAVGHRQQADPELRCGRRLVVHCLPERHRQLGRYAPPLERPVPVPLQSPVLPCRDEQLNNRRRCRRLGQVALEHVEQQQRVEDGPADDAGALELRVVDVT